MCVRKSQEIVGGVNTAKKTLFIKSKGVCRGQKKQSCHLGGSSFYYLRVNNLACGSLTFYRDVHEDVSLAGDW